MEDSCSRSAPRRYRYSVEVREAPAGGAVPPIRQCDRSVGYACHCTLAWSDRQVFVVLGGLEAFEDWAMRAMVAVTGLDEHLQRMRHVLKVLDLVFKLVDVALRQPLDVGALPRSVPAIMPPSR